MKISHKYLPVIILLGGVILFQLVSTLTGIEYILTQMTMAGYYAMVIIGLTMLMGYTGQISLGHAGFFAIGGYTTAVLTTRNLAALKGTGLADFIVKSGLSVSMTDTYGQELTYLSPWVSLTLAIVITIIVAFLIGIPILKLKGHYLAMATLGFGTIIYRIVLGAGIFGEADGISEVPALPVWGGLSISADSALRVENYYIAWFVLAVGVLLLINLVNSRAGRALRSIHGSEDAASAMGVDTARYKLAIFILSAVYAAVGGVLLTHFNGGIGPSEASIMKSVRYVAIVAVGGMANLWGALIMGVLLNFLSLRGYFGSYDDAFFGVILIIIMLFFPDGLLTRDNLKGLMQKMQRLVMREKRTAE